jgi:hypothetical protein
LINFEVWFVTGAQLLYGGDAVVQVDGHSKEMVNGMNNSGRLPIKVVYKGTANSSKEVADIMSAANNDKKCVGVITWMHTFSPGKMWIHGLADFKKASAAPAHSIQQANSLGYYGHGFHEPEPECSWRPRIRTYSFSSAQASQDSRRLLERRKDIGSHCSMVTCLCRLG